MMAVAPTSTYEWLVLAAILFGPLIGVWVTRLIDTVNEKKDRRWKLFETLRRTRGLELSPDHVAAINMIPVLFDHDKDTMTEWEKLMAALNNVGWNSDDEQVREAVFRATENARHNLVRRIAKIVGAKLPEKEEHRLGYAPIAWQVELKEQVEVRARLLEVLGGERPLKMLAGVYDLGAQAEGAEPLQEALRPELGGAAGLDTTED